MPILPDQGNGYQQNVETFCSNNSGEKGGIRVHVEFEPGAEDTGLEIKIYDSAGKVVGTQFATFSDDYYFYNLPDGSYKIETNFAGDISRGSAHISCYVAPVSPPFDQPKPGELLIERKYTSSTTEQRADGTYYKYPGYAFFFNTETETVRRAEGASYVKYPVSQATIPQNYFIDEDTKYVYDGHPYFFDKCVLNTTTKREFYYQYTGIVTKKEIANSTACGFVAVTGCTDPTATNYNASANVDDGSCYYRPQVFGCTDPNASNYDPLATDNDGTCTYVTAPKEGIFNVSLVNPLHFIYPETVDGCSVLQTFENTFFCRSWENIKNPGYLQKVQQCDPTRIQFKSNYASNIVEIRSLNNQTVVGTITPEVVLTNTGESELFAGYLKDHGNNQTRVYFNTKDIPVPIYAGSLITISGTTGHNGEYTTADIEQDIKLKTPYVVINRNYGAGGAVTEATIKVKFWAVEYNVLEAVIDWNLYPEGFYYVSITATDAALPEAYAASEPIDLADKQPGTNVIEYRNYDNAFDMQYSTGIVNRIRVESEFQQRQPGGESAVFTTASGRPVKLGATAFRRVNFRTFFLPPWLHEKLFFIFQHDFVSINGVEFLASGPYGEPEYLEQYSLSNSSVLLQQVKLFNNMNGHDLPGFDKTLPNSDYIIGDGTESYIKA